MQRSRFLSTVLEPLAVLSTINMVIYNAIVRVMSHVTCYVSDVPCGCTRALGLRCAAYYSQGQA
jgi:hypothetical protein